MTVTSLVMQNRRGHASGKRPLRLPIIAPKEDAPGKLESSLIAPPRIRLPPRSRTGCWYVFSFSQPSFFSFLLLSLGPSVLGNVNMIQDMSGESSYLFPTADHADQDDRDDHRSPDILELN